MARTVLQFLQDEGIYVEAVCGGAGTCGKCVVEVGGVPCLACQTIYDGQLITKCDPLDDDGFAVLSAEVSGIDSGPYGLALDIGTTTIAFALVDLESGKVVASYGVVNSQRAYGADVISRIKAASEGKLEALRKSVMDDISRGISCIGAEIRKIVIAGNTAMLHILMGEDCRSLGQYPFTPVFLEMREWELNGVPALVLPGISAFVGADIVAGVYSLDRDDYLLADLGTNGEIVLVSDGEITATAAAAGPAFEGGNISCGTGSIPGAIYKYDVLGAYTIGKKRPIGLCGSGVIDVAAFCVKNGIINETGAMERALEVAPGVNFTPKDVRELQLAKSAVRAGIEVLLGDLSDSKKSEINSMYLAGGFGHSLNVESAFILGILPGIFRGKVCAVGNSSLAGCVRFLTESTDFAFLKNVREIELSAHPRWGELFMDYMMFEKQ